MPKAEIILWSKLKGKQLYGYKFRRQYSVNQFIIDFYCPKLRLAIELDGNSHVGELAKQYDDFRQEQIEKYNIRFLRFKNNDLYENLDGVLRRIIQEFPKNKN